jgi:sensor histidine kinase YesM
MDFQKSNYAKYLFHVLFWITVLMSMAADVSSLYFSDVYWFFFFIVAKTFIQIVLVYINLLILYPLFFKKKQYVRYTIFLAAFTLCAGYCNMQLEIARSKGIAFDSGLAHFLFFLSQLGMAARYVLISFLLQITVDFYKQKELFKKIEVEKATAELNFLKAQVNPHFLFNTLNNLYALILEKSDSSGEAVLKLADIMKYILSEGKENRVRLQKETDMLYNYCELERLRKPNAEISFITHGDMHSVFITPLLLLPLVENAFKYGLNSVSKNGFVRINISAEGEKLQVTVENNLPAVNANISQTNEVTPLQSLGLGIENVKKRLQLLYPGMYDLIIENRTDSFFVKLKLSLV